MGEVVFGCRGCGRILGAQHTTSCPVRREDHVFMVHKSHCKEWSAAIDPKPRRGKARTYADKAHLKPVEGVTLEPPPRDVA